MGVLAGVRRSAVRRTLFFLSLRSKPPMSIDQPRVLLRSWHAARRVSRARGEYLPHFSPRFSAHPMTRYDLPIARFFIDKR